MDSPLILPTTIEGYKKLARELDSCSQEWQRETVRDLSRHDLFFLLWYVCARVDMERPWIMERCREVQNSPDGHLDLWSREHYKSTIITYGKTLQDLLIDPNRTFGIFSYSRPLAKGFLRQIKREFESNAILRWAFPDIIWNKPDRESPKWSEDEGIVLKRTANHKEGSIEAWGLVDGQPVGRHFYGLIYDDVVTQASVTSPDMMQKTVEMLELSYSLGTDGGIRRAIGTRYHFNDAYRTMIERGSFHQRTRLATDDGTINGNLAIWSRKKLEEKRRDMGPYTFACQIMQNPVADGVMGFKREWLKFYDDEPGEIADGTNLYLMVDAASEKKKSSDYTAMWVVGLNGDRNAYVVDMVRDRFNLTERARKVIELHRKWRPRQVRYEQYGMQADVEHIRHLQREENYRFNIEEVGGSTPKVDRIRRLIAWFEQGRIWLPRVMAYRDYEGIARDLVSSFIEDEYVAFPVAVHDDMLDSLARLLEPDLALLWPLGEREPKESKEDRYLKRWREQMSANASAWAA